LGEGFLDKREWVSVLDRKSVQGSIVDTETEASTRLLSKKYRGGGWRGTGTDEAFLEVVMQPFAEDS
jgi:hypothetical protein